jgi:hypothetical protein
MKTSKYKSRGGGVEVEGTGGEIGDQQSSVRLAEWQVQDFKAG